jgi:hypothetical protein
VPYSDEEAQMPDLREVFEMTTKQMGEPDVDPWREQEKRQRRASRNRKFGAITVAAVVVLAGVILGISALRTDDGPPDGVGSNPEASPLTVADGPLEPGRYVISTTDPDFNASHRITIHVPVKGYSGWEGIAVLKDATEDGDTGVAMWVVDDVFTDACEWRGTRSSISSADDLVAILARQEALSPSTPLRDDSVGGLAATSMKLTTPSLAKIDRCDGSQFRLWTEPGGGPRYLNNPGEEENLWILDVDGAVLVIDNPISADAPFNDRVDTYIGMMSSIRIERR